MPELDKALLAEIEALASEGRTKAPERVIVGYLPPRGERGPRYRLAGSDREYLRMNSNSYLSLSHHPALIEAADEATRKFGVGPGAVRFIDGTFSLHVALEERIARFVGKPAAKIFNSAYTANCGFALAISNKQTYWIGDQLNHNSIIRAMRIANVPTAQRGIYAHNDMEELKRCLETVPEEMERVVIIFDGVFSMRGDCAPIDEIQRMAGLYDRTNPLGVADCAAAIKAIEICDSPEGRRRLRDLQENIQRFRQGIASLGRESIPGPHPIVPLLVRDTAKTHRLVQHLFEQGTLVVGLTYPVVPRGDETIRFQLNAVHTKADIDEVLEALAAFEG